MRPLKHADGKRSKGGTMPLKWWRRKKARRKLARRKLARKSKRGNR